MVQVYTGFGYDGAGACRRIKDQIVDILAKEGKTWEQVVNSAVTELAAKPATSAATPTPVSQNKDSEPTVGQLIAEAEELKKLLDKFGENLGGSSESNNVAVVAAVP
jgi:dihydroorotate dehydrogenase